MGPSASDIIKELDRRISNLEKLIKHSSNNRSWYKNRRDTLSSFKEWLEQELDKDLNKMNSGLPHG